MSGPDENQRLLWTPLWVWQGLSNIVTTLGVLGLLFAGVQYWQAREEGRAAETLNLIDIWETRGYDDDFAKLRAAVTEFMAAVPEADMAAVATNARAAENLRTKMYRQVLGQPELEAAFERVVYFYNRLGLCVQANLCSTRTARIFFAEPFAAFRSNFASRIESDSAALPGYANGLDLLAERILD